MCCTLSGHKSWIMKIIVTDNEKFIVSGDIFYELWIWNVNQKRKELKFTYEEKATSWLSEQKIDLDSVKSFLMA